ncbi:MAG: asparagine synthase (glutamine-hydrolyzing) [Rhodothermales bacterium]
MCGIAGILKLSGEPLPDGKVIARMASELAHRGPDDEGSLVEGPVALGFRRLSIIDLQTGHQPIANEDETVWVILNGEIYNYLELRSQLIKQGHRFRTQTDTEVIVHAYESYGLDFVEHLRGMFAIALWDTKARRLILARDRLGQKPLFYSIENGELAFASELKALLHWPHLDRSLDAKALHDYLTFLYVPSPDCIFEGVCKLPPAHVLVATCSGIAPSIQRYWDVMPIPDRSKPETYFVDGLRDVLREAVRLRLRSDVPLGAFLSGGIDSTIITGLMSRMESAVRTFSVGFLDNRFDESVLARKTASGFETDHTEAVIDENSLDPEQLIRLVWHMDEPFGDSSFIPTYWVAKMARQHVTVALSGDGGDELFAGYPRYRRFQQLTTLSKTPSVFKKTGRQLADMAMRFSMPLSSAFAERMRQVRKGFDVSQLGFNDRILALLSYYDESSKSDLYSPVWEERCNGYSSRERIDRRLATIPEECEPLLRFMAHDLVSNMTDDSLVKVDRASMTCSLEVRSPFLDHRVVEFASTIPPEYKIRGKTHKAILKQAFADLIPPHVLKANKQGFEVPFARWFQADPWRSLMVDMLSGQRLKDQGIFDVQQVLYLRDTLINDPEARRIPLSAYQLRHRVWMLLIFQIWYHQYMQ